MRERIRIGCLEFSGLFGPLVLFVLVTAAAEWVLGFCFDLLLQLLPDGAALALAKRQVYTAAVIPALASLAGVLAIRRPVREELGRLRVRQPGRYPRTLFVFGASAVSLALAVNGWMSLIGASGEQGISLPLLPGLVVYGLVSPVVEESVFRLVTYARLERALAGEEETDRITGGKAAALLAASLLFGLYHGQLWQGIYAFLMGAVFQLGLLLTGRFRYVVCLHGVINAVVLVLGALSWYSHLVRGSVVAGLFALAFCGFAIVLSGTGK